MPTETPPQGNWGIREQRHSDRPRVLIIGAGVAGMAAGSYAQMNGFDTRILEKHVLPGGCCTAWSRKGYIFDYCIDWLIGTAPGNDANQIWRELGALDGKTVTNFEMFNQVFDERGRSVTFFNDPDRLEAHLLEISPADERLIRRFCRDLRKFVRLEMYPFLKPARLDTPREKIKFLRTVLPAFSLLWRNGATQMTAFAERFEDPLLRRALPLIFFQDHECFPILPYLYNIASAHKNNAGFPQGGSLGLSRSIEERYLQLGGSIHYRSRVARILVENDTAVGVELKDGSRLYSDFVISACDGLTAIYEMLGGRYVDKTIDKLYGEMLQRPGLLYPGVVSVFVGIDGEVEPNAPHTATYLLGDHEADRLPHASQRSIVVQMRSRYSDEFAPPARSLIHCTYFSDFDHWQTLRTRDRKQYRAEKDRVADFVRDYLDQLYPGVRERIDVVSVSTPATTKRYTGNHKGSILAWKSFTDADPLLSKLVNRRRMHLAGLDRFAMAGQWIGGGGVIRAASTGRFVVQYLCQDFGRDFVTSESRVQEPWNRAKLGHLPQLDTRMNEVIGR